MTEENFGPGQVSLPTKQTPILKLLAEYYRESPRKSVIVLGSLLLSAVADGIGLVSIFPLLSVILDETAGNSSPVGAAVTEALNYIGVEANITNLFIVIVASSFLKGALVMTAMVQVGYAVADVATGYRLKLIRALMAARWSFFLQHPIGSFGNALGLEAQSAASVYLAAAKLAAHSIQILIYTIIAFAAAWQASVAALIAAAIILLVLGRLVTIAKKAGVVRVHAYEILQQRLSDALQGIKPLKAMSSEGRVAKMLESESQVLNNALRINVFTKTGMQAAQEPLIIAMLAAGLIIATGRTEFSTGTLIVLGLVFVRTTSRVADFQKALRDLRSHQAFRDSIDNKIRMATAAAEDSGGQAAPPFSTKLEIEQVDFSYGDAPVFKNLSLKVEAGEITTIFGSSGVGKSTLMDLITGFYEPDKGQILIDGIPLSAISKPSWRKKIGFVPQEMFLFHDSIRNNVTLGDTSYSDAEIQDALTKADAWGFVSDSPEGIDLIVGERGGKLSGGQRQRVSIARALIRKPRLLILDEPMTALDPAAEKRICKTLKNIGQDVTLLLISHQKAVADIADKVLDLEELVRSDS